jgi:hypothetical protein
VPRKQPKKSRLWVTDGPLPTAPRAAAKGGWRDRPEPGGPSPAARARRIAANRAQSATLGPTARAPRPGSGGARPTGTTAWSWLHPWTSCRACVTARDDLASGQTSFTPTRPYEHRRRRTSTVAAARAPSPPQGLPGSLHPAPHRSARRENQQLAGPAPLGCRAHTGRARPRAPPCHPPQATAMSPRYLRRLRAIGPDPPQPPRQHRP